MKNAAAAGQDLPDGSDNFEEDFELMTGKQGKSSDHGSEYDSEDSINNFLNEDDGSDEELDSNSEFEGKYNYVMLVKVLGILKQRKSKKTVYWFLKGGDAQGMTCQGYSFFS